MRSPASSLGPKRQLARDLILFLSKYKHISDSYIIEFFSEELWEKLPVSWQEALGDLSAPQVADLLLDQTLTERCYPSVWPLSLLAFRSSAHALAFPRMPGELRARQPAATQPEEFQQNRSQSSLLGHIFRKHIKPKKQHEIRKLGLLVKNVCDILGCSTVVDVGSGQGHLTRFLSFGLGLSVTGIEAEPALVSMALKFDGQLLTTLQKESRRKSNKTDNSLPATGPAPHHIIGWVNPKTSWENFVNQLESKGQTSQSFRADRDHLSLLTKADPTAIHNCQEAACPDLPTSPKRQYMSERELSCRPLFDSSSSTASCAEADICVWSPVERGAGHPGEFILTGLHACGDLSATLLRHFASCPHVLGITSVACCYMKITTQENPTVPGVLAPPSPAHLEEASESESGYPMSLWVTGLPGHQLSYKAREGACHAIEGYLQRLRDDREALRTHCYRAALEVVIRGQRPDMRRAAIHTIRNAHLLPFSEYARLGLERVGLPPDLPLDHAKLDAMLHQQGRVVVYFSLALLLAPVVETLLLLDRMLFLQEKGLQSELVPLFDPAFSPRNLVLVSMKPVQKRKESRSTVQPAAL